MMKASQLLGAGSDPPSPAPFLALSDAGVTPGRAASPSYGLQAINVNRSGLEGAPHEPPKLQNIFVESVRKAEALAARALECHALLRAPVLFQAQQYQPLAAATLEDDAS